MVPRPAIRSLVVALTVLAAPAAAQDTCGMGGCRSDPTAVVTPGESRLTTREVFLMAGEILAVAGLANNLKVEETMEVHNAAAYIVDQERRIGFNPLWVLRFRDLPRDARWPLYAVIAHEIGHHLLGHTIGRGGSRPATELEADAFAGFVLHALGASLSEAQHLWQDFGEDGSETHPPRAARLAAVERGWLRSAAQTGGTAPPAARHVTDSPPDAHALRQDRPDLPTDAICAPLPKNVGRGRICASSAADVASVARLTDGGIRAAWTERVPGPGTGARILYDYAAPFSAARLSIVNGDNSGEKAFRRAARLEAITLTGSNGHRRTITVRDTRAEQTWTLAGFEGVAWIDIHVDSVIRGRRYDTLAVSRLRID